MKKLLLRIFSVLVVLSIIQVNISILCFATNDNYTPKLTGRISDDKSLLTLTANIPNADGYEGTDMDPDSGYVGFIIDFVDGCQGTISFDETCDYGEFHIKDGNRFSESCEETVTSDSFLILLWSEDEFKVHLGGNLESDHLASIKPVPGSLFLDQGIKFSETSWYATVMNCDLTKCYSSWDQIELDGTVFKNDESDLSKLDYIASFKSPSVTTIEPTSEQPFTVPVVMTSESALSGAELDLSCNPEVAKISGITLAEGLTANGNQNIAADGSSAKISFYGNEQSAKEGLTVATVTMQPVAEGTSSLSITKGTAAMSGTTLEYPVTVPDSPVTVEVKSQDTISTSTYVSTSDGVVTLLKYTPGTAPEEGKVPAYDGTAMYQGPDHTWLCLVKGDPDKAKIGMTDGTAASVAHPQKGETLGTPADLNNTDGRVNIVDAQIAYDLATGKYTEIAPALTDTSIDLLHWLMADVNGDETVTAQDARAIQSFIHTQEWFKDAA